MKNRKKLIFAILLIAGLVINGCDDIFDSDSSSSSNYGSITVTPASVTLVRGETQQFSADQSWVDWSLEGSTGSSNVNSSGLLTVGLDETVATLTVKASKSNYTTGTAKVTIVSSSAVPSGLKVTKPGPSSIALSWSAMSGVSQYTIQRSTNGTSFGTIGTASGTSYTDTAVAVSTSYYYRIQANGVNSPVVYTFSADYFNMPAFSQRKLIPLNAYNKHYYRFAVTTGNEYTIEWQDGNNQNTPGYFRVAAYQNNGTQIFARDGYGSSGGGGFTYPAVFTATASGFVTVEVHNDRNSSQNYQIYFYGSDENPDAGTVALPPYQVTAFRVSSPSQDSITLTWDSVSDAASYNIYRSNTQSVTPGKIGESSSTFYTDNLVPTGGSFWYTIAAVNNDGREGCRFQGAFGVAASHFTLSLFSSTQTYSINSGAKQYFRLAVTQGSSYTIEWQDGNNQNTPGYFRVAAYQNNGTQIFARDGYGSSGGGGFTYPAVFTATASGFVTVEVHNDRSSSQNYQIYYY